MKRTIFTLLFLIPITVFGQFSVSPSNEKVFGKLEEGVIADAEFIIKNNSGSVGEIKEVRPACGCTTADPSKKILKPGEESKISVHYDTKNRIGPFAKLITVVIAGDKTTSMELYLKGEVVVADAPKLAFEDNKVDLGSIIIGTQVKKSISLHNMGRKPLVISEILQGKNNLLMSPITIKPNSAFIWDFEMKSPLKEGIFSDVLVFKSNDRNASEKYLTLVGKSVH